MQTTVARILISLLVVGGCNRDGTSEMFDGGDDPSNDGSNGGSNDGSIDGATPDGPATGDVEVSTFGYTGGVYGPLVNTPVVAYKPDGSVASVYYTGGDGRVTATIQPRSLIVVIYGEHRSDIQVEGAIASPGQTFEFGGRISPTTPIGTLSLSWPARVFPGGYTVYYDVITPCGGYETTATSMQVTLTQECAPGPFDVAVTSRRSSQGESAWMLRRGVVPAAQVAVAFGDGGATWEFVDRALVTVTNEPTVFDSATCSAGQYIGQRGFNVDSATIRAGQCDLPFMPGGETVWKVSGIWRRSLNFASVTIQHAVPPGTPAAIDAAQLLPWPTSISYEPSTRQVTWTSPPASVDSSRLQIRRAYELMWQIWVPDGLPPTWTLPSLPTEFSAWDFGATDATHASVLNTDVVGEPSSYLLEHGLYWPPVISGQIIRTSQLFSE